MVRRVAFAVAVCRLDPRIKAVALPERVTPVEARVCNWPAPAPARVTVVWPPPRASVPNDSVVLALVPLPVNASVELALRVTVAESPIRLLRFDAELSSVSVAAVTLIAAEERIEPLAPPSVRAPAFTADVPE